MKKTMAKVSEDLLPEYNFDYTKAKPNRFAYVEQKVTYVLEVDGKLVVIENVLARVRLQTGEQLFAPETVERLQKLVAGKSHPRRVMEVPVFEFA
jgi:hypothetical protein